MRSIPKVRAALAAAVLSITVVAGCGGSTSAYTPGSNEARRALDAALAAWQKGDKPEGLAATSPAVEVADFQWKAGQALDRYEILNEAPNGGDAAVRFAVSLRLKKAKGETKAEYVVVGRDPVWVYRAEDYARFLNMDDNPKAPPTRRKR